MIVSTSEMHDFFTKSQGRGVQDSARQKRDGRNTAGSGKGEGRTGGCKTANGHCIFVRGIGGGGHGSTIAQRHERERRLPLVRHMNENNYFTAVILLYIPYFVF